VRIFVKNNNHYRKCTSLDSIQNLINHRASFTTPSNSLGNNFYNIFDGIISYRAWTVANFHKEHRSTLLILQLSDQLATLRNTHAVWPKLSRLMEPIAAASVTESQCSLSKTTCNGTYFHLSVYMTTTASTFKSKSY